MRIFLYLVSGLILTLVAAYYGTFYVMPSITVINNSGTKIKAAIINLPTSHLDFGQISQGQTNTVHYSLDQADGVYKYQFDFTDRPSIRGECGYLTQNEVNKRVSLTISSNGVVCS